MAVLRRKQMRFAPKGAPSMPLPAGPLPEPDAPTATAERGLKLVRTVSKNQRGVLGVSPVTCLAEIEEAHIRLIGAARRLIYIESQFLRSPADRPRRWRARQRRGPGSASSWCCRPRPEQIAFDKKSGIPERAGRASP